jgi:hypothetical protein
MMTKKSEDIARSPMDMTPGLSATWASDVQLGLEGFAERLVSVCRKLFYVRTNRGSRAWPELGGV